MTARGVIEVFPQTHLLTGDKVHTSGQPDQYKSVRNSQRFFSGFEVSDPLEV